LRKENKVTMSRSTLSVVLAALLLAGALVALGITRATAQENPNSQPSASKYAADDSGGSFQAAARTQKTVLWAVVNRNGTLARGQGALDANAFGGGTYEVLFDRNVRRCAYTATIGLSGAEGTEEPGEITVVGRFDARNGVFITTHDSSGTGENRGFHLTLNCPR
jgi:xanthine dehydrogenase molybdopterin-binding subunit B